MTFIKTIMFQWDVTENHTHTQLCSHWDNQWNISIHLSESRTGHLVSTKSQEGGINKIICNRIYNRIAFVKSTLETRD